MFVRCFALLCFALDDSRVEVPPPPKNIFDLLLTDDRPIDCVWDIPIVKILCRAD